MLYLSLLFKSQKKNVEENTRNIAFKYIRNCLAILLLKWQLVL